MKEENDRRVSILICGFLEVAMQAVLHNRGIMSRRDFKKINYRGVELHLSNDEQTETDLLSCLDTIQMSLAQYSNAQVLFMLKEDKNRDPFEMIVFECNMRKPLLSYDTTLTDAFGEMLGFFTAINIHYYDKVVQTGLDNKKLHFEWISYSDIEGPNSQPYRIFPKFVNSPVAKPWREITPIHSETTDLYELRLYSCERPTPKPLSWMQERQEVQFFTHR